MSNFQTNQIPRFAEMFKALSNPHRLDIFLRLASCCPPGTKCSGDAEIRQCVGEIGKGLSIDPSTLSHHLKELRRSGLIHMERSGRNIQCWVDPDAVQSLANLLAVCHCVCKPEEQDSRGLGGLNEKSASG